MSLRPMDQKTLTRYTQKNSNSSIFSLIYFRSVPVDYDFMPYLNTFHRTFRHSQSISQVFLLPFVLDEVLGISAGALTSSFAVNVSFHTLLQPN